MTDLLFSDLAPPTPAAPPPDTLADALIAHGHVHNRFLFDLNGSLNAGAAEKSYPWSLPSRLFQFPIKITRQAEDGSRNIGLLHPLLAEHPFVKHVESTLGIKIDPNGAPNEYGYSKTSIGQWWHAVDLISAGRWEDLLKTAQFTTPEHIAGAVSFGLRYSHHEGKKRSGYISTVEAREIMASIESYEPTDRNAIVDQHFMRPSPCKSEKGSESWPINRAEREQPYEAAWGMILGIEAGYFAHDRAGFLGWTPRGRERFPPEKRETVARPLEPPMPPTPTSALTDEIAPRPTAGSATQLDLF